MLYALHITMYEYHHYMCDSNTYVNHTQICLYQVPVMRDQFAKKGHIMNTLV